MFEGDSAKMCANEVSLPSMGGRAEDLACADPRARTPIGVSENFIYFHTPLYGVAGSRLYCMFVKNVF